MHISAAILVSLVPICLAAASSGGGYGSPPQPDVYEAIHQRENILAVTIDTKDWGRLHESMTDDIYYDSTALGPDYGVVSRSLAELINNLKKFTGNSMVASHVSNAVITPNKDATQASVITYITRTQWDPNALHDPKKTFRLYYRCDDVFVLEKGNWKMSKSTVTPLAPKAENPYFNDGQKT